MIIDFHTHAFPEKIVERALQKLALSSHTRPYTAGTCEALSRSAKAAGIDYSVILPVATKPEQCQTINRTALEICMSGEETGLISFGGIHPDYPGYRGLLRELASSGIRGVKLHPAYQGTAFDDIRYLRIMECAFENHLTVVTHAGYDIGFPGVDLVSPRHILSVLRQLQPERLVLAHMGGWQCWDEAERDLCGAPVYFDTAFSVTPLRPPVFAKDGSLNTDWQDTGCQMRNINAGVICKLDNPAGEERSQMEPAQFLRMIRKHGADRILFGSDSPWSSQTETLALLRGSGLTEDELSLIEGGNAKRLLGL